MGFLALRDVLTRLGVNVEGSQAEVKQVDQLVRIASDFFSLFVGEGLLQRFLVLLNGLEDKVFRLYVSVNDASVVNLLKPRKLHYSSYK